jgi:hypothetical protein
MSSQSKMLFKEARLLVWPWAAVMLAGMSAALMPISFLGHSTATLIYTAGFAIGFPLLATLSLGSEFQNATLSLLLGQPVDRMKIWSMKWWVLVAAVATSALVYVAGRTVFPTLGLRGLVFASAWVVVTVCSGMFWTLVAKSVIGGLVLNLGQFVIMSSGISFVEWLLGPEPSPATTRIELYGAAVTALCYGAVMLWLGRRKLARFESTGVVTNEDFLAGHPGVTGALTGWLRCEPTSPTLNLIRKELRLIWPLWFLMLVTIAMLIVLVPFHLFTDSSNSLIRFPWIAALVVTMYVFLALLLPGAVSMGEERNLRTQSLQLMLPVSPNREWLVKVTVVVLSTFISLVLVVKPARLAFGKSFGDLIFEYGNYGVSQLLVLSLLSLAAFWCACCVSGTVRAALCAIPALYSIPVAFDFARRLAERIGQADLMYAVVSKYHTFNFRYDFTDLLYKYHAAEVLIWGLPLTVALIQSRRYFRREVRDNLTSAINYLCLPAAVMFVFVFSLQLVHAFAMENGRQYTLVIGEVHQNIRRLRLDLANTDAAHPRELTPEELAKVLSSEKSRQFLDGSSIAVYAGVNFLPPSSASMLNFATTVVRFPNGETCRAADWVNRKTELPMPFPFVRCPDPNNEQGSQSNK